MPRGAANYGGHGNVRARQRRGRGVPSLCTRIDISGADDMVLARVGCFGSCFQEPLVNVRLPGQPLVMLRRVQAE